MTQPMLASEPASPRAEPVTHDAPPPGDRLTPREEKILIALAAAAMPEGAFLQGGGPVTVQRMYRLLDSYDALMKRSVRAMLWIAEMASVPTHGRPLSSLPLEARTRFLEDWEKSRLHLSRALLRAILTPIKAAHFDDRAMFEHTGCRYETEKVSVVEAERWRRQVTDGRTVEEDLDLECEVVVIGTGAGGAAAAYELASRGRAVVLLEEGDYHDRRSFNGRTTPAYKSMYRDQGLTIALGNVGIPVWAGRAVGGSTVVNSGTCYRAPERTFRRWRERYGLTEMSDASLAPYYERAEAMLQVTPADPKYLGGVARVIGRGADRLRLSHHALTRNAPACDGQGVCCFGCPTGAKRSTDVSYVPEALKKGAQLVTAARVDSIDVVAGRARGVRAQLGSGKTLRVKAEAVIVAGGAFMTPLLLKKSKLCGSSGWLGKNLSIHPASKVVALFDERIDASSAIPQGYAVDTYAEEGLLFEGGSTPVDVTAVGVPFVGKRFMDVIEQFPKLALFGFMIQDHSRGEVRPGPGGRPLILYNLSREDTARMQRGIEILCEIFLAANAKRVLPMLAGMDEVSTRRDLDALRRRRLAPGDFEVTAFHPLGTARMGTDPQRSVVGPDNEAHDVAGLYVCDGAALPSSLGVNPQMTIMAVALRCGEIVDSRLS